MYHISVFRQSFVVHTLFTGRRGVARRVTPASPNEIKDENAVGFLPPLPPNDPPSGL
ncbi:MAG: hypothetical protein HZA90_16495 [Verrucomicrobia bacterium]|nr:hypothetical protein [Verrucomicrobiota bacterium]